MGQQYDDLRRHLCEAISQLNSVANIQGKGRDDLTYEILMGAQNVLGKVTDSQSPSIRNIADKIRQKFKNIREVLRFFGENIQMVDPQLRNNPQLVVVLQQYQVYWEKGKRYFMERKKQRQILALQVIIQAAREKYRLFADMLEYSDPNIFWVIPSLIILRSLQGEDEGLTASLFADVGLFDKTHEHIKLINAYQTWKMTQTTINDYQCYNQLQQRIITGQYQTQQKNIQNNTQQCSDDVPTRIVLKVRELAVSLQRGNPKDWNEILSIMLSDKE